MISTAEIEKVTLYRVKLPIWAIVKVEFVGEPNMSVEDVIERAVKLAHKKDIDWGYDEMAMDTDEMISTTEE